MFNDTIVSLDPGRSVTFVDSHDTQTGKEESGDSNVRDWFKPQAYALILLRELGYPCIFYPDYFGNAHPQFPQTSFRPVLDLMLQLRKSHTVGERHDYFDAPKCIGWSWSNGMRALVVVISAGKDNQIKAHSLPPGLVLHECVPGGTSSARTIQLDEHGIAVVECRSLGISFWASRN